MVSLWCLAARTGIKLYFTQAKKQTIRTLRYLEYSAIVPAATLCWALTTWAIHFATLDGLDSAFEAFSAEMTKLSITWVAIWLSACTKAAKNRNTDSRATPETRGEWATPYISFKRSCSTSGNVTDGDSSRRSARTVRAWERSDISEIDIYVLTWGISEEGRSKGTANL